MRCFSRTALLRAAAAAALALFSTACSSDSPGTTEPEPEPDVYSGQLSATQSSDIYLADSAVVTLTVTNQNGQAAAGQAVFFNVTSGSASLSGGPSWTTNSSGQASTVVRGNAPGSVTVAGYLGTNAAGTSAGSVSLAFIADEVSAGLSISAEGDLLMNEEPVLTFLATNQNGDPVEGQNVTFKISGGTGVAALVGGPTEATDASGVATVSLAALQPGSVEVSAYLGSTPEGEPAGEVSVTFVIGPPAALRFIQQPTLTLPGVEFLISPVVEVIDEAGVRVPDAELAITLDVNPGFPLSGQTTVTSVDGVATFERITLDAIWAGLRLTATVKDLGSFESEPLTSMYRDSFSFTSSTPCMVADTGSVYCWGSNADQHAGAGDQQYAPSPTLIADEGYSYTQVHSGQLFACGLEGAQSHARCWGAGRYLGNPEAPEFYGSLPLPVQPTHNFDRLAAGPVTACARVEYENFQCWGANESAQMGDGTQTSEWGLLKPGFDNTSLEKVSLSEDNGCGIDAEGDLYCWGRSDLGVVGNNYSGQIPQTRPALVGYEHKWRSVSVGPTAACAITDQHELYCWGSNQYGLLATTVRSSDQIAQAPQPTAFDGAVLDVSVGTSSACAVMATGHMTCWGTSLMIPDDRGTNLYEVEVPAAISNFSVGQGVGCFVDMEGEASCFGSNAFAAIGNPLILIGVGNVVYPTSVAGGHRFVTHP